MVIAVISKRICAYLLLTVSAFLLNFSCAFAQKDTLKRTRITRSAEDEPDADLMKLVEKQKKTIKPIQPYTEATFKTTRIANGQSIENLGKGLLDFRIVHRFGALNQAAKNFYGIDNAVTALELDYGITDGVMVGLSRGTYEKEYDGFVKIRILRQRNDDLMPLSLSYSGNISVQTSPAPILQPGQEYYFTNRLYFVNQLLVAKKINSSLSLQLMPTHIHYNLVEEREDPNNIFAIGLGGRMKISKRIACSLEYYYGIPGHKFGDSHNSLSLGIDIETGGHVFQLVFTNATSVTERAFIGQTYDDWAHGGVHFGFNMSRVFPIHHNKPLSSGL